jgi:hypothetical protein
MNEARWLACEDPRKLLEWLRGVASDRKLRLFVCAFWRNWWYMDAQPDGESGPVKLQLLAYAEQWAEGEVQPQGPFPEGGIGWHPLVARNAFDAANWTIRQTAGFKSRLDCYRNDLKDRSQAAEQQVRLLREIVGNPYRTVAIDPNWVPPNVVALARTIYDDKGFDRLPILADALEEVACDNEGILSHCRCGEPHVRGCWVVDLILGQALATTSGGGG